MSSPSCRRFQMSMNTASARCCISVIPIVVPVYIAQVGSVMRVRRFSVATKPMRKSHHRMQQLMIYMQLSIKTEAPANLCKIL